MSGGEWKYDTAKDIGKPLAERLKGIPREPDITVYVLRSMAAVIIRAWMRVYHRLTITGVEHLCFDRPCVVVANHTSHLDTLMILSAFPKRTLHRIYPAAAADYFFSSIPRTLFTGIVINALPFDRKTKPAESLAVCEYLLNEGKGILIIFPEGTRTQTGELGAFKSGVAHIVAGTDVPVVPCRIHGGFEAWPKGARFPRPRRIRLAFGPAHSFETFTKDKRSYLAICDALRSAVDSL